jgi:ABC-type Mn2+/Zn2+ transport system permease subunit
VEILTDPWTWWVEPFVDNVFMQRALWAGLLAVLCTSVIGTWVVLRGMSFLGDALAHGVLPGIAVAFAIGANTTVGAFIAALVMVGAVALVRNYSPLPEDTSIGVMFVGFLALAVVIMSSQSGSYVGDLNRFLFGSVTGVTPGDLWFQVAVAAITLVGALLFHRAFLVMTFNTTQAALLGFRPKLAHAALLVLLAVAIVGSFRTVGSLLVFAFLVAPPATATLLVRRVPLIMATAVALGAIAVVIGLLVSYHHETAAGGTMALTSVTMFVAVLVGVSAIRAGSAIIPRRQHRLT